MNINMDVVLHSNPVKNLLIAFDNLKNDYSEENAKKYMELYENQPLRFIMDNSRYIFSETMYGLDFYKNIIESPYAFLFTDYEYQRDKLVDWFDEFSDKMDIIQKNMYEDLINLLSSKFIETNNTSTILNHAFSDESIKETYDKLVELVYMYGRRDIDNSNEERLKNEIIELMNNVNNSDLFYALSPYLSKIGLFETTSMSFIYDNIDKYYSDCHIENERIDEQEWKKFIESVIIVSKLYHDDMYIEAVNSMRRQDKIIFSALATESVKEQIDDLSIRYVNESYNIHYSTPSGAVNRIFEDHHYYSIFKEDNNAIKTEREKLKDLALNIIKEYVDIEYYNCTDAMAEIQGYNFFEEGTTIENAFMIINEGMNPTGEPSKTVSGRSTSLREDSRAADISKKVSAPKANSLASSIQHKAMDTEAKQFKSMAKNQQKGQEIKNAVKAITNIPKNVIDSIKKTSEEWENSDDERRRQYMVQPGYRKRVYKNLKLAILYGSAAQISWALIPITALAHFVSKKKNIRIRRELVKELETEIKVCEEKINDASANGDQKEKYKLMRIKSSLEQDLLRVKTNSKYV